PDSLAPLESQVRGIVEDRVARGRVEVRVDVELQPGREAGASVLFDRAAFEAIASELKDLSDRFELGRVEVSDVLEFRDRVIDDSAASAEVVGEVLLEAVSDATDAMVEARRVEGEALASDLRSHLDDLADALERFRTLLPDEREVLRGRITERVREAMEDYRGEEPREERLAREIVYHADRADVSEEVERTAAHVESLRELLDDARPGESIGKELDFYLQELVRETNTMSAKSHSAALTDAAIEMKSTVERMREQAANVE
ncbi:MAG: YicC family protein, partial [Bradymonadaceae bacterium]